MQPLFTEKQQFRQPWLWLILAGVSAIVLWAILRAPDEIGAGVLVAIAVLVILPVAFWRWRLVVAVSPDAIDIRFFPVRRRITLAELVSVRARPYRPIREFGGWGIRWSPGKRAYTVSGTGGVELELRHGPTILIGSQRPAELARAIARAGGFDEQPS